MSTESSAPVPPTQRKLFADAGLALDVLRQKALQLAVWVLLLEAVIALLTVVLRSLPIQLVTFAVEATLALALWRNLRWARPTTVTVMLVAMVFPLVGGFRGLPLPAMALAELPYVAVLLLLLGKPQPWRLTLARCALIVRIFLTLVSLPATIAAALNAH